MKHDTQLPTPIIILGRTGAARQQCLAQLGSSEELHFLAVGATMREVAVPDLANPHRGVVVYCVDHHATGAMLANDLQAIRAGAPAWPILAVGQPPALLHPHISGWLSLSSPLDLVAALRVVASGGWVCERVADLALLHPRETVHVQIGHAA